MIRFWCGPHGSSNQEGISKVFGPTPESTKAIISWLRKCAETLGYKNYEIIDHEGSIADEQTLAFAINNREGTDLPRFYFKEQKKKTTAKPTPQPSSSSFSSSSSSAAAAAEAIPEEVSYPIYDGWASTLGYNNALRVCAAAAAAPARAASPLASDQVRPARIYANSNITNLLQVFVNIFSS